MMMPKSLESLAQRRIQMELLAGVQVSTKSVERQAEQIGDEIVRLEQAEIQRSVQLQLPMPQGDPIPVMYVEIDATGIPVVKKETQGRIGKVEGKPAHTREVKLGCVFTSVGVDRENRPIRDEASTTYTGAIETAGEFARRIYREAYQRGWSRSRIKVVLGTALSGSGIWPPSSSRKPFSSWTSIMPVSIFTSSRDGCIPATTRRAEVGRPGLWICSTRAQSIR